MRPIAHEKDFRLPKKYDGVVEAVRYNPDGSLQTARIYERRGPTWSDHILISRNELIKRLKLGQKFVTGSRKELLASTFEVKAPVVLAALDGKETLTSDQTPTGHDQLAAPLF